MMIMTFPWHAQCCVCVCVLDKLNSIELTSDGPMWKHSMAVFNCFKRALEMDSTNLALWIEYSTMSYAVYSFTSRQLKQWRTELPSEVIKPVQWTTSVQNTHMHCVLCSTFLNFMDVTSSHAVCEFIVQ